MAARSVVGKAPRLGRKEIFLPNFTLTLLRTPDLPPTFASFQVPLNLNKLDLRDYLWNCYGIRAISVRSFIQLQKLTHGKPSAKSMVPRNYHRPRSIKKMTVEMESPFVWPAEPKDLEPWDNAVQKGMKEESQEKQKYIGYLAHKAPLPDVKSFAAQAKALMNNKEPWRTGNSNTWKNIGEEREVETHVQLPRGGQE